ncbi:MAG: hypothetical protein Q9M26_00270 [Mariprofundales bacterium]|nr:hypothetical protein [Mariprofundales bacterium]
MGSIAEEMEMMFKEQRQKKLVEYPLLFKSALQIDDKTQKSLFTSVASETMGIAGAAGGAVAATAAFSGSLGVLGGLGAAIGLVSTPIGWIAGGAAAGYALMKVLNKGKSCADNAVYEKVARFIDAPIDDMASGLCYLMLPPLMMAAYSDGKYEDTQRQMIIEYFCKKWGLNELAFIIILESVESNFICSEWDSLDLAQTINDSLGMLVNEKNRMDTKTLCSNIRNKICEISQDIVESDGIITKTEDMFIRRLKRDLETVSK